MRNKRAGFTLVELMVAMALTLFIMVILSQAFVLALETFAGMKGIGDMQINLRTAASMLRDDLAQDHFEGKRRLSDVNAAGQSQIVLQQPQAGFFAVLQGSTATATAPAPYLLEGTDTNGVPSYRATDHILYFTVKRRGNQPQNFFTASLVGTGAVLGPNPPNSPPAAYFELQTAYDVSPLALPDQTFTQQYTPVSAGALTTAYYASQWAEVVYFLVRTGSTEEPNNPTSTLGTPLFGLYRAQFVMLPDGTYVSGKFPAPLETKTFQGLTCLKNNANLVDFYSPADAATVNPSAPPVVKRIAPNLVQLQPGSNNVVTNRIMNNMTLVLPNVVSFEVQVMQTGATTFGPVPTTNIPPVAGVAQPQRLFDTALNNFSGYSNNTFGLKAIQVSMRVWDTGTRQTRQVTVGQDL